MQQMEHNDLVATIKFIRPNAEFVLQGDELNWLDTQQSKPTESEIEAGFIAYQAKVEADKIEADQKRVAAENKLVALGFTLDDLKALGLA